MKKFSNIAFIVIYGIVHIDLITTVQTPFNFINTGNDNKISLVLIFFEKIRLCYYQFEKQVNIIFPRLEVTDKLYLV